MTQSRTSFILASFPVRIANNYRVSVNLRSFAISTALVDGFVSVFVDVFVAGVVLKGELTEKLTRAFFGVDFSVLVLGILDIEYVERLFDEIILSLFRVKSEIFLGWLFLYSLICTFALIWLSCVDYLSWCQTWASLGLIFQIVHILYCLIFALHFLQNS